MVIYVSEFSFVKNKVIIATKIAADTFVYTAVWFLAIYLN